MWNFKPQDHYFHKAKAEGYKARSAFKLEEIDKKFQIFDTWVKTVLDIGCAPGSWMQYAHQSSPKALIIGFDLKKTELNLPEVFPYVQDIEDREGVKAHLETHQISWCDVIISDMAPNTMGFKDIDALRSISLLEQTLRIYETYLKPEGKFVIKIFMGPGFDQFVKHLRERYGAKHIKMFKPQASRSQSKETYIIKI